MFILNQISGIGDFSIADNLRLIVIAAIFIGIIVVLLYLKSAKSGRKTERKYMQETNPYDSSSNEEKHSADVVDDFLSIEEDIKGVRVEIIMKIEALILKIEEREKEVINKVENVIDKKVQEVLSKINDRIDEVLQAQKNSTALVLEKMINSLRQKEKPVGVKSSKQSNKVPEKTKREDLEIPSEVSEDIKAERGGPIVSLETIEKNVLEVDKVDSADFDIHEFLEELENLPSEKDPEAEK